MQIKIWESVLKILWIPLVHEFFAKPWLTTRKWPMWSICTSVQLGIRTKNSLILEMVSSFQLSKQGIKPPKGGGCIFCNKSAILAQLHCFYLAWLTWLPTTKWLAHRLNVGLGRCCWCCPGVSTKLSSQLCYSFYPSHSPPTQLHCSLACKLQGKITMRPNSPQLHPVRKIYIYILLLSLVQTDVTAHV